MFIGEKIVYKSLYERVAFEKAPQNFSAWVSQNFASFCDGCSIRQHVSQNQKNASILLNL